VKKEEGDIRIGYKDGKLPSTDPSSIAVTAATESSELMYPEEKKEEEKQLREEEREEIQKISEEEHIQILKQEIDETEQEEMKVEETERNGGGVGAKASILLHSPDYYEARYLAWQIEYNFALSDPVERSENEETISRLLEERYMIFVENDIFIEKHNKKVKERKESYTLDHNEFSHLTFEEFLTHNLGYDTTTTTIIAEEEDELEELNEIDEVSHINTIKKLSFPSSSSFSSSSTLPAITSSSSSSSYLFKKYNGDLFTVEVPEERKGGNEMRWNLRSLSSTSARRQFSSQRRELMMNVPLPSKIYYGSDYLDNQEMAIVRDDLLIIYPAEDENDSVSIYIDDGWQFYSSGVYTSKKTFSSSSRLSVDVLIQEYGNNVYKVSVTRANFTYTFFTTNLVMVNENTIAPKNEQKKLTGSATGVDCGGASIIFDSLTFTPNDLKEEELSTMTATGTLTKPLQSGSFTLTTFLEGTEIFSTDGDICSEDTKISLPADSGTLNVYGFTCPIEPGPVKFGLDVILPSIAPFGEYIIDIKGKDQDDTPLMCIETTLDIDS
jgi:hypothetical protein